MKQHERAIEPGHTTLALGDPIPVPRELTRDIRATVRARASDLLCRAIDGKPGWTPPPFDPRLLARGLGIPILYKRGLRGVDALIVRRHGQFKILADSGVRSAGRLNFSLAHEIAHTFFESATDSVHLRAHDRSVYDETPEGQVLERLCDVAASELLMPEAWFRPAALEAGFNARSVPLLAERFGVSLEAAALRMLRVFDDAPRAVGFFHYALRPSEEQNKSQRASSGVARYRVRRVFRSKGFPFLFPAGKSVPNTSVVYRASLQRAMLRAPEHHILGSSAARLEVSAQSLRRADDPEGPPTVCATFCL